MIVGDTPGAWLHGRISAEARTVWAKHDRKSDGWLPLWRHLADSGAVAGLLWDSWAPRHSKLIVAEALPGGLDDARQLLVWLAATHDVGKATPAFACQVDPLAERMRSAGLDMPLYKQLTDRRLAPHGLAGQVLLREWLGERGWGRSATLPFTVIAGGHHGVPPTNDDIRTLNVHRHLLRTPECSALWRKVQWEIMDACAAMCGIDDRLDSWRDVKLSQTAQAVLSGLVIVADWIASNSDLFPYFPDGQKASDQERLEAAWRGLALPEPWRPVEPKMSVDDLFAARFELPKDACVRPVQERAVAVARGMASPGLLVIEAPMGEGKTEAALAVAEVFAARSGAGGVFVALPTMATSNAMFPRLLSWMRRTPDEGTGTARSVTLAHSKAALNDDFRDLVRAGWSIRGVDVDADGAGDKWRPRADHRAAPSELVAHQWLRGRKKAMLASVVVGTVDQLLFMGLKSRHLALRHLAVAGKVVVIDEAHAYDAYMNSYLDRVLAWLGAYRVPVIVLSATLPAGRRRELAEAYAGTSDLDAVEKARGYPLLTAVEPARPALVEEVEPSGRRTDVRVEPLSDDLDVLADRLERELAGGGCALVVRNTVDRVLDTARCLRERFGDGEVSVAHARFVDLDRVAKDARLLDRFGPSGDRRPARHVVVASQVAEQSLDIDFDILVTDLCPVDLLLQRMGRLHRHVRERPDRLRTAQCLVTGADWDAVPVEPVKPSQRIYSLHVLLRSAAVLQPYSAGRMVRLPEDISPLVQSVYGTSSVGPPEWQEPMARAHEKHMTQQQVQRRKAESFQIADVGRPGRALTGWVDAGVGDADDTRAGRAQVRDSRESLEVLVVQRLPDGTVRTLPHLPEGRGARQVPTDAAPPPDVARVVAACGLRLPFRFTIPEILDRAIGELEAECVPAWQSKECPWLEGELILMLDENCQARLAGHDLRYSGTDGLEVTRAG